MDIVLEHLRRPITLIGVFCVAAVVIVATSGGSDPSRASGYDDLSNPALLEPARTRPLTGSTQILLERGIRAFEIGRFDDAIAFYTAALRREPNSATIYNLLGIAYRHRFAALRVPNDRALEIESFRQAVRIDPTYVPALVNLGITLYQEGRHDEAAQALVRALTIDPNHPDRVQLARMAGLPQ